MSEKRDIRPEAAYLLHPTQAGCVVQVRKGMSGFWPITSGGAPEEAAQLARRLNRANGLRLTPAMAEAMLVGSMFGWDVPGAFPEAYYGGASCGAVMHPEAERE